MMGGLATANDLGAAIGPIVAYALAARYGLDTAYTLCAVITTTAVAALAKTSRTRPDPRSPSPAGGEGARG